MPARPDYLGAFKAHLAAQGGTRQPSPPAPPPAVPTHADLVAGVLAKARRAAMPKLPRFAPVVEAFQAALAAAEQDATPNTLTTLATAAEAVGECHLETNNLVAIYPLKAVAKSLRDLA